MSEFAYEALLHDAAEAFVGDVTRPFEQLLSEYRRIEASVADAIMERSGMDRGFKKEVKAADLGVLAAEQAKAMAPGCADWAEEAGISPASVRVRYLDPILAKREFLNRFERYAAERSKGTGRLLIRGEGAVRPGPAGEGLACGGPPGSPTDDAAERPPTVADAPSPSAEEASNTHRRHVRVA